jgi:protoheme IX farnesyltransferase
VFAVVAGAYMALARNHSHPPFDLLFLTTIGTFLAAAGAAALNMYRERHLDPLMLRTQGRPLPTGSSVAAAGARVRRARVRRRAARVVRRGAARARWVAAHRHLNWVAACCRRRDRVSYVLVYTPMKVRTPLNTLVGAIPGALPPVVGHAAVVGKLAMPQLVLFAILFCWQIPHFLAIAWRYREDYARAGMRMLPVLDPTGIAPASRCCSTSPGSASPALMPF